MTDFQPGYQPGYTNPAGMPGSGGFPVPYVRASLGGRTVAYLLDLDPLWRNAGVIFAACPVGLNVYVFAQHYEVAIETASSAILISTALALVTITALLLLLPPVVR